MKVVRNDVVSLDWDAEGFVQHKKEGFIGCTFETGGVDVLFIDQNAVLVVDEEGNPFSKNEIVDMLKSAVKDGDSPWDVVVEPGYIPMGKIYIDDDGSTSIRMEENLSGYDIDMDEIKRRLEDLAGYWTPIYE